MRTELYDSFFGMHAHIEYSRLLAEHGLLGAAALLLLLILGGSRLLRARRGRSRAVVIALLGFAYAYMLINGMRIAMPSFVIGLCFATILLPGGVIRFTRRPLGPLPPGPRVNGR